MSERSDLVSKTCHYLKTNTRVQKGRANLAYPYETWLNAHHTKQYEWLLQNIIASRKIPSNNRERGIILHAGKLYFCFTI